MFFLRATGSGPAAASNKGSSAETKGDSPSKDDKREEQDEKDRAQSDAEGQEEAEEQAEQQKDGRLPYEEHLALSNSEAWNTVSQGQVVYLDRVEVKEQARPPDRMQWKNSPPWTVDVVLCTHIEENGAVDADEWADGYRLDKPTGTIAFYDEEGQLLSKARNTTSRIRLRWGSSITKVKAVATGGGGRWSCELELPGDDETGEEGAFLLLVRDTSGQPDGGGGSGGTTGSYVNDGTRGPYEPLLKKKAKDEWKKVEKTSTFHLGHVSLTAPPPVPGDVPWVNYHSWELDVVGVVAVESDGEVDEREYADGLKIERIPKRANLRFLDAKTEEVLLEDRDFEKHIELHWDDTISEIVVEASIKVPKRTWWAKIAVPTTEEAWLDGGLVVLVRGDREKVAGTAKTPSGPPPADTGGEDKPYEIVLHDEDKDAWKKLRKSELICLGHTTSKTKPPAPDAMGWKNGKGWDVALVGVEATEKDGEKDEHEIIDGLTVSRIPNSAGIRVFDAVSGELLVDDREFESSLRLVWDGTVEKIKIEAKKGKKTWTATVTLPGPSHWSDAAVVMLQKEKA